MHIYNWYHLDIEGIHYVHEHVTVYFWVIPLLSAFLFSFPFAPHSSPFTYLEPSLLWQDPIHLVPRLLVNWSPRFPSPTHIPLIPKSRPPGVSWTQIYIYKDDIANLGHKIQHSKYTILAVKIKYNIWFFFVWYCLLSPITIQYHKSKVASLSNTVIHKCCYCLFLIDQAVTIKVSRESSVDTWPY